MTLATLLAKVNQTCDLGDLVRAFPGSAGAPAPFELFVGELGDQASGFGTVQVQSSTAPWLVFESTCRAYGVSGTRCLFAVYFDASGVGTPDIYLLLCPPVGKKLSLGPLDTLLQRFGWQGSEFVLVANQSWEPRYGDWLSTLGKLPSGHWSAAFGEHYRTWKPAFGLSHHGAWSLGGGGRSDPFSSIGHLLPSQFQTAYVSALYRAAVTASGASVPAEVTLELAWPEKYTVHASSPEVSIQDLYLGFTLFEGDGSPAELTVDLGGSMSFGRLEFSFEAIVPLGSGEDVSLSGRVTTPVALDDLPFPEDLRGEIKALLPATLPTPSFDGEVGLSISDSFAITGWSVGAAIGSGEHESNQALVELPAPFSFELDSLELTVQNHGTTEVVAAAEGKVLSIPLVAEFRYPDKVFNAGLQPGAATTFAAIARSLSLSLGQEASGILEQFEISDLALEADLTERSFAFEFAIASTWKAADLFTLNELKVFLLYDAGASPAAWTFLVTGSFTLGENLLLEALLEIDHEADGTQLVLQAETGEGTEIHIGDFIADLAREIGGGSTDVPEVIESLVIDHVGARVDLGPATDLEFDCSGSLEIEGETLRLRVTVAASKASGSWKFGFTGVVTVLGRQFEFDLDEAGGELFLLASYLSEDGDKIWLHTLLSAVSPELGENLPLDPEIILEEALVAVHKGEKLELLAGLFLDIPVDFSHFPLLGPMLPKDIGLHEVQIMAASADVPGAAIEAMNVHLQAPKRPIGLPPGEGSMLRKGFSLTGSLDLGVLKLPLQLHFGGGKATAPAPGASAGGEAGAPEAAPAAAAGPASGATFPAGPAAQQPVGKKIGPINIRKAGLSCSGGDIGLEITGGLSLAAFEFELLGLEVKVPQTVLEDPSQLEHIHFGLRGFAADIKKGTLAIAGGFLHEHFDADPQAVPPKPAFDEYTGVIQVAFPPFSLTGMGSYAEYAGHTSLFLFVALGFPISVNPSLIFTGMALGFGIHRDCIAPEVDKILDYPLVAASVTPPPPIHIEELLEEINAYFPPMVDEFFVVAGIKFKAFGLIDNLAMLEVKFGREMEIDLLGVSSVFLAATFVELEWKVTFVPAEGYLFLGGQLTDRSYLLVPMAHLTGGFAVAAWMLGEHQGEFVVTVGGYPASFDLPPYYPQHVARLGIAFTLESILTIHGGVYFAITPKAIYMGGAIEASLHMGPVTGYLRLTMDFVIWYQPFHFDARIAIDAGVKVDLPVALFTVHFDVHLHAGMHLWGPAFSGVVELDLHVKTFHVAFGAASSAKVLPSTWEAFQGKFLPADQVCSVAVTGGLLRKVTETTREIYVVDPKHVMLEARTTMPFTTSDVRGFASPQDPYEPGITPMGVTSYTATFSVTIVAPQADSFGYEVLTSSVPAAIWGREGLVTGQPSAAGSLEPNALTGFRVTPGDDPEGGASASLDPETLGFETSPAMLHAELAIDRLTADAPGAAPSAAGTPLAAFTSWTGLQLEAPSEEAQPQELLNGQLSWEKLLSAPRTARLGAGSESGADG